MSNLVVGRMPGRMHGPVLGAIVTVAALALSQAASAEQAFCPNAAHASPTRVAADLVPRVARAFQIDDAAARNGAYVRCDGANLLACYVGANLNCFKADTRHTLPGATAWCRDHPGSPSIPMVATGHETVYAWSCKDDRAIAGRRVIEVDARGYVARNWKPIPR